MSQMVGTDALKSQPSQPTAISGLSPDLVA
jgi:hypothetical protein